VCANCTRVENYSTNYNATSHSREIEGRAFLIAVAKKEIVAAIVFSDVTLSKKDIKSEMPMTHTARSFDKIDSFETQKGAISVSSF